MSDQEKKPREFPPWARTGLLLVLGLAVLAALIFAFRPSPVEVDLASVERGTMEVAVSEDGKTRLQDRYVVSSPLAGTLERVHWRPGDRVEVGEALFHLRPMAAPILDSRSRAQAQASLEAARANLEQARARAEAVEGGLVEARQELRRQEILLAEAGGSESAVERARARLRSQEAEERSARFAVQAAEQEVQNARLLLERGDGVDASERIPIWSPVEGSILRVMQESEAAVQAGAPILEVGDVANLEIVVDLLSADAVRVEPGQRAEIERWGGEETLVARVRQVEPSAFTRVSALGIEEQRVNVVLELDEPRETWAMLGDGFRVEARIVVWEEEAVLRAPASAVFRDGDGWFVFRVEGDRARRTQVEVGRRSDADAQILSGLESGDRLILYPGERVEDGVRVHAR